MLSPLALTVWLATAPSPDFLEVRQVGSDHQVLATGGLLYRWTGRGALSLEAELGAPMAALHTCEGRRSVAVGPRGRMRMSLPGGLGWRPVPLEGAKDLWAVDSASCAQVLAVGEEGALWEGSLEEAEPRFRRLPSPTRLPLYGVAVAQARAVVVGAGGTVLARRGAAAPFEVVASGTEAPLLAVTWVDGERFVVAGAGGLWLGEGASLRQVLADEQDVFTRVVFSDRTTGVALGQDRLFTTTDGGQTWRPMAIAGALSVVPLSGPRFLVVGREGLWRYIEVTPPEPSGAPVHAPARTAPVETAKPAAPPKPAAPTPSEVKDVPAPAVRKDMPPPVEERCRLKLEKQHMREGFVDLKTAVGGTFVASGDGTVRRVEGNELKIAHRTGEPMLGVAVSQEGVLVTVTGWGALASSENGGRSFRTVRAPSDTAFFAGAYAGDALLVFDARGQGWRSGEGGTFQPVSLPRQVTYYGLSFVDALRGYASGECGTLLETADGGRSWKVLGTPMKKDISGVLAFGDTVYLSGSEGVFRSGDRGRTFKQVLDEKQGCIRLARRGPEVAVACHRGLHYAPEGETFSLVPVPHQSALLAAAFLPSGELGAVGARELFIRAQPTGGAIVNRSPAVERWLKLSEQWQLELRREAPKSPPKVVTVQAPAKVPGN
ncbi:WD40/YVTN/BNR-like repeat-containing protein [Stigmatella aurantiaca]|uniref:BNR repeat domain protein n=1 Tax=Stigmatella aurantiaca (strain DW4/3-1) TaxID=378806 RepID=Q09BJ9_STIAD|nr:hypothetical protein [Stigmatella aurantiaca]ADO68993.1 BNR repeat domain protein [Stigmatella aurantiaca DW4/3-1]EAU69014.1 BNR/Asp-box repeat domain protein [Stigmatella aurantiaca DW4/3-1]